MRAAGLSLTIDDKPILRGLDFEAPAEAITALLGANGAGKSSLLRILATLTHPSGGELEMFGLPIRSAMWKIRSKIGVIAHQPMLYRDLSAKENLEFFAKLYDVANPSARAMELLEMVGLPHRADDQIKTLSRGMTQRVSIARALMHDPDLLLADEPFNGLDAPSIDALERLLTQLRKNGKTVILANHDIHQSLKLASKVIVLRLGRIVIDQDAGSLDEAGVLEALSGK